MAGVLFCTALSVEDTLRPIAIQRDKHYLRADFMIDKAFYDDVTESQGYDGDNVTSAERRSAAALTRASCARWG
jgi:hypothetical protein